MYDFNVAGEAGISPTLLNLDFIFEVSQILTTIRRILFELYFSPIL
jgi:hypothetical protein